MSSTSPAVGQDAGKAVGTSVMGALRYTVRFMSRPSLQFSALAALLLMDASVAVMSPYGMKLTLDAIPATDWAMFLRGLMFWAASFTITAFVEGVGTKLRMTILETIALNQRKSLMARAVSLPLLTSDRLPRGDVASRMTADVTESSKMVTNLYFLANTVTMAAAGSAYLLLLSWQVGLFIIASSVVVVLVGRRANAGVPAKARTYRASLGATSARALNILEGRVVLKSFLAEKRMEGTFDQEAGTVADAGIRLATHISQATFLSAICAFLPFVASIGYGGRMVAMGSLSFGGILALLHLSDYISPLAMIGQRLSEIQKSNGALERVREFLDLPAEDRAVASHEAEPVAGAAPVLGSLAIRVEDLSFRYEEGRPVLRGISFEVPLGSKVAIMGRSGSGKSTLLKILAGLYPVSPGSVLVNGEFLEEGAMAKVRSTVTYAPQEPFLFPGTVRENLRIAKPGADDGDLMDALRSGDAEGFVTALAGGLDSQVGEKGNRLSGGQRQRLSLARTNLRGTPLVLLDEPTSALDAGSESRIVEALAASRDVTCVIVTHRFPVSEACDTVLVLDGGMIVEAGDHESLLERHGLYWALYTGQKSFSSSKDGREPL